MASRNIICWLINNGHDVKAEIVNLNIEVFSALYISVALQNAAKLSTTLAVMAVDAVQLKATISDKMMKGVDQIYLSTATQRVSTFRQLIFNQVEGSTQKIAPCSKVNQ
ncbi:unnamed protein product [Phytophthora lilii]|uniref:Unnamed protein product n=1 Tax=Phytophthora lilii TaxID=2077276 RepID=A0A9W6U977_9STRA|nr:unnamed protein product [Phytophthora lilii]